MAEHTEEIYSEDEFARCFALRGYGSRADAREWLRRRNRKSAREADFEQCWREMRQQPISAHKAKCIALNCDGSNPVEPESVPNSRGPSFAERMRREQRRTDAAEKYWRKRLEGEHDEK